MDPQHPLCRLVSRFKSCHTCPDVLNRRSCWMIIEKSAVSSGSLSVQVTCGTRLTSVVTTYEVDSVSNQCTAKEQFSCAILCRNLQ